MNIGIDQLSFYTPHYYLELAALAAHHKINPDKYRLGIGQERMAIAPLDEDIISMAANAAAPLLQNHSPDNIDTILFATESSVDQAKSAAVSVHRLLKLPSNCRTVELKQACYSATAALQLACAYIARHPKRKVLILASDIARYDLDGPAEPTQGAAAIAMLISADPRLVTIEPISGLYSEDIMDFWRPNYRKTPLVDGKYSALAYLKALEHAWHDYQHNGGDDYATHTAFCYHLPFNKMGIKAHAHLARINQCHADENALTAGLLYSRETGNSYTASLYASLASLLDNRNDLAGKRIGLFSYGSGCTGEYFTATISHDYQTHRRGDQHRALLAARQAIDYPTYLRYWHAVEGNSNLTLPRDNPAPYRLAAIENHCRRYDTP
ncbi:MAG: hydroxymethylglutaryl-CoA synthase [Cardiobacteriaceae bacterium]|nr:hydroxymethylglutaryl-CoA synthase [Cardiobacteriaceae bacterium]